ncbi:hypothetical protein ACIPSK_26315 [Rhizobium sp. LARHSG275]
MASVFLPIEPPPLTNKTFGNEAGIFRNQEGDGARQSPQAAMHSEY